MSPKDFTACYSYHKTVPQFMIPKEMYANDVPFKAVGARFSLRRLFFEHCFCWYLVQKNECDVFKDEAASQDVLISPDQMTGTVEVVPDSACKDVDLCWRKNVNKIMRSGRI